MPHLLSKSTFIRGCQCEKSLYLNKHRPDLKAPRTSSQQAIFDRGTTVGELAQKLFPNGIDASPEFYYDYAPSVALTKHLIDSGTEVIYEAAFQHDDVLVAVDILAKIHGEWKGFEVKSSTKVQDVYILDAALQYRVITQAGIDLKDISIVYLNKLYVKHGRIDVKKLFTIESILESVLERQADLPVQIDRLKYILSLPEMPARDIGEQCGDPYPCDFMGHCWHHVPYPSVFDIAKLRTKRATTLYHQGIIRFEDITDEVELTDSQRLQVRAHLDQKEHIDLDALREFLATLTYPMYFLDFETFNPAIPLYEGTRPYQQIPFQYSIHYKKSPEGELRHTEFLASPRDSSKVFGESVVGNRSIGLPEATDLLTTDHRPTGLHVDPRPAFIENLLSKTKLPGTILTYNQNFEITRLKELARDFSMYSTDLNERISRIKDLMIPFRKMFYYHPSMQGSYSIKSVLPSMVPELTYDNLAIAEGGDASLAFEQMIYDLTSNHEEIRMDLLIYCKMDTLAMVRVVERLEGLSA